MYSVVIGRESSHSDLSEVIACKLFILMDASVYLF